MIVHFEIQCPMWMAFFFRSLDCLSLQLVFGNLKLGSHCFLSFLEHFVGQVFVSLVKKNN